MSLIYAKLVAILFANALSLPPSKPAPPPRETAAQIEFRECLEEHDLEADENDGECEEP